MREHDIMQAAFQQVMERLGEGDPARVNMIHFARGEMFELDEPFIQEAWTKIRKASGLEQAQIIFRLIEAEVQCMACFEKYHPKDGKIHCPNCGSFGAKILAGEEFYLDSIETQHE